MYDLFLDLARHSNLSLASTVLLVLVFFLARQRYLEIRERHEEHENRLDRIEKTFIQQGIPLYEED